jgi:hypothetical protein
LAGFQILARATLWKNTNFGAGSHDITCFMWDLIISITNQALVMNLASDTPEKFKAEKL